MKVKKYIFIIMLALTIIIIFIISKFLNSNEDNSINIEIFDNIILETSVISGSIITNEIEKKYYYNFIENKINLLEDEKVNGKNYDYNKQFGEIEVVNGKLYVNKKLKFECGSIVCYHYFSPNGKYIIFLDRFIYKEYFFKKTLPYDTFTVFNLETLKYKKFPILKYNGKNLDITGISFMD